MNRLVEIICIGTELLIGKTLNTNGRWLAKRATTMGLKVHRIVTVGDDVNEISSALQEALQRSPRFIISTGGLGPTFDDMTLEGVAKALGVELKIHDQALRMVEEKYREYVEECRLEKAELTPYRVKMARLPEEARPLINPVGTAPGVIIEHKGATIIALPGVPSEMEAIFEESVAPLFKEAAGNVVFFETSLDATRLMESEVAPLIDQTMRDNPYVYIKSHPKGTEKVPRIELHLSTTAEEPETAKNRIGKALIQISEMVQSKGGKVKPLKVKS
jgi:molybdenum cofactor synthesis domain-containing protein